MPPKTKTLRDYLLDSSLWKEGDNPLRGIWFVDLHLNSKPSTLYSVIALRDQLILQQEIIKSNRLEGQVIVISYFEGIPCGLGLYGLSMGCLNHPRANKRQIRDLELYVSKLVPREV